MGMRQGEVAHPPFFANPLVSVTTLVKGCFYICPSWLPTVGLAPC